MNRKLKSILFFISAISSLAYASPTVLEVKYMPITVDGHTAKYATIQQPNGTWGYISQEGQQYNVIVKNELNVPTVIHWHGLILPNKEDGVLLTQNNKAIQPGQQMHYQFKLKQSGTYWMHFHYKLQEQMGVEAPLIIENPHDKYNDQQVVIMFQDFSFTKPEKILADLKKDSSNDKPMSMPMKPDLNDVNYDAYLTNYHQDSHPEIRYVKKGSDVRLRFINGASASNFWINLGKLDGKLIAVDGHDIHAINGSKFQLGISQRADIIIHIPKSGGTFPILGQVEGLKNQTGVILTTNPLLTSATIPNKAKKASPALNYDQSYQLHSLTMPQTAAQKVHFKVVLTGDMQNYQWKLNGKSWPNTTPLTVKQGKQVDIQFVNKSNMSHPMHLHGYAFNIVKINGKPINGATRDVILVQPHSTVTIQFVANHPGKWLLHCHMLYHLAAGMETYLNVIPS
ncbi:multicopper oxidase family protein [Thiotrichales bacterium 19S3-7]|nr:multicopper oxidase family protein [Thiotrichales bacterium 19S3-7]MCF6803016.1 multicopper oxidase family protein [Thiotrichales bacterium 19S3-11]